MTDTPSAAGLLPLIIADIYELAGAFRRRGGAAAGAVGQTQARWQVLSAASGRDARTVPQLARRLGVSRQNVQQIADRLVADGLAQFAANPDHRTSPVVVLTEPGRRLLARLGALGRDGNAVLAAAAGALDLAALHAQLRVLRAAVQSCETTSTEEKA